MPAGIRVQTITPSGAGYDLTDQCEGLSWSSVQPGGDERCSFSLKRQWFAGAPEIAMGNVVRVAAGLDVLWQGVIDENDRAVADAEQIGVIAYGMGIKLKDNASYREVIVDQDLGRWGAPPLNRQIAMGAAGFDYASLSWGSDPPNGLLCALPNQALGAQVAGEVWYDAGSGLVLAKAMYAGTDVTLPAGWEAPALVATPDDAAATTESYAATFDGTLRTITITTPRRYVRWREYSNGTASTPAAGASRRLGKIALYGNHALTLRDPGDGNPWGVLASDVVAYIVAKASGVAVRRVDASAFVIPQLAWTSPVTYEQAIADALKFDSPAMAWGVWGPSSALDSSTTGYFDLTAGDPTTQHWMALRSQCDDVALNVERSTLFDSVDVYYADATSGGQGQVVTRTLASSDLERPRTAVLQGGTLTTAAAQDLGDWFLALAGGYAPARGSVTLSGPLQHYRRGALQPWYMRADGSNLRLPDVLPSKDLFSLSSSPDRRTTFPIKRLSVDCSGAVPKVTVEVDQTNDTLAALQAQLAVENQLALTR